jgi:hypothetical protein
MSDAPQSDSPEKEPLSPKTKAILALIQGLLPAMTAIVGGLWVAITYLEQQKEARAQQEIQAQRDNKTRLLEARKPFLDKQLALYGQAPRSQENLSPSILLYLPTGIKTSNYLKNSIGPNFLWLRMRR